MEQGAAPADRSEIAAAVAADRAAVAKVIFAFIMCMAFVFVLLGAYAGSFGDAANSRLATVYSLTKHGTFYIDAVGDDVNRFERGTIDKVVIDGRILSSKPPMLPLFMTAEYIVLNTLFGWDLDSPEDTEEILRWMAIVLIGGSYLLILLFFWKTSAFVVPDPMIRVFMLFALAFATQLWGYSFNINNHVPGTAPLMIALYYAVGMAVGKLKMTPLRLFMFGLFGGLTFTLDMPATIFIFLAGLYLLKLKPVPALIFCGIGVAIPVLTHAGIMLSVTGHIVPVQSRPELYLSETSYWRHPLGIDALNEPKGNYLFHMFLGRTGLFSLYPILLAGAAAALRAVSGKPIPLRGAILTGAAGVLVMTVYYVFKTNNYGGESFGFRWFIVAMPVLMLMAGPIFMGLRKNWQWVFVGLMLGISFYSAWECTKNPWRSNAEWTSRFLGRSYYW